MRKILLLSLALGLNIISMAQKIEWKKNGLTWNDFTGTYYSNAKTQSEFSYEIGYNSEKTKVNDSIIQRYKIYCQTSPYLNWVNPAYKTDELLKYNQVIFDIVELYKRKLQKAVNSMDKNTQLSDLFSSYNEECKRRLAEYRNQTEYGVNSTIVNQWSEKISQELDNTFNTILTDYKYGWFGYGMHGGGGFGTPTGDLKNYFGAYPIFIYGFDFSINKYILFLNATLGGTTIKKDYTEGSKIWKKGKSVGVFIAEASVGYAFLDKAKYRLSPFFGVAGLSYSGTGDDKDNSLTNTNLIVGVNCDYKHRKVFNITTADWFKEYYDYGLRTRFYMTHNNFYSDLNGFTLNFAISIYGFGHKIHMK